MTQPPKRLDGSEHLSRANPEHQQELMIQAQRRITLTGGFRCLPAAKKTDLVTVFLNQTPNFFFQPWFLGREKTKYKAG
jgi:hypothetical protein